MGKKFPLVPLALILVGVFFLGRNLGFIHLGDRFFQVWWPVIPLVVGVCWLVKRRTPQGQ